MVDLNDARSTRKTSRIQRLGFTPSENPTAAQRNPIKVIRRNCLECCGGSSKLVETCPSSTCPLFAFRLGFNPYRDASTRPAPKPRILNAGTASPEGSNDE